MPAFAKDNQEPEPKVYLEQGLLEGSLGASSPGCITASTGRAIAAPPNPVTLPAAQALRAEQGNAGPQMG